MVGHFVMGQSIKRFQSPHYFGDHEQAGLQDQFACHGRGKQPPSLVCFGGIVTGEEAQENVWYRRKPYALDFSARARPRAAATWRRILPKSSGRFFGCTEPSRSRMVRWTGFKTISSPRRWNEIRSPRCSPS